MSGKCYMYLLLIYHQCTNVRWSTGTIVKEAKGASQLFSHSRVIASANPVEFWSVVLRHGLDNRTCEHTQYTVNHFLLVSRRSGQELMNLFNAVESKEKTSTLWSI